MPIDYEQKSRLDINAKKLDKVRQRDESITNTSTQPKVKRERFIPNLALLPSRLYI